MHIANFAASAGITAKLALLANGQNQGEPMSSVPMSLRLIANFDACHDRGSTFCLKWFLNDEPP